MSGRAVISSAESPISPPVQERNVLLEELIRRQDCADLSSDLQVLEAQKVRLTLLEEKIKEVLIMLRSLNSMVRSKNEQVKTRLSECETFRQNISSRTLGKLVLDAVQRSVDPLTKEVQVFKFLNHLYHSVRDFERLTTENQVSNVLITEPR